MNRIINISLLLLFFVALLGCKPSAKLKVIKQTKDEKNITSSFYRTYSEKFGYDLEGNEDAVFLKMADSWLGVPYKYGGCDKRGTDCSCFVTAFYKDYYHINLPRKSEDMQKQAKEIEMAELQTGDLVFFKIKSEKISHVGIYISKRHFIHASTSKGVMINSLDENYYKTYFYKAGRIR